MRSDLAWRGSLGSRETGLKDALVLCQRLGHTGRAGSACMGGERMPAHAADVRVLDAGFKFPARALGACQAGLRRWVHGWSFGVVGMSGMTVRSRGTTGGQAAERQGREQCGVKK